MIIITGYAGHGKDTVCKYIEYKYNLKFISSSKKACDLFIFDALKAPMGYISKKACYNDRVNHRALWYELIRAYNHRDRARLGTVIHEQYHIYNGIRDLDEFKELKSKGLVSCTFWVDASKRLDAEPESSMKLSKEDADCIIDNNSTLNQLYNYIDHYYGHYFHKERSRSHIPHTSE